LHSQTAEKQTDKNKIANDSTEYRRDAGRRNSSFVSHVDEAGDIE